MNHVSLFTGIGGFDLACDWAGIETIVQVEQDKFCQKVLKKHWPSVPIINDVRDIDGIKEAIRQTLADTARRENDKREGRNLAQTSKAREGSDTASSFSSTDGREARSESAITILSAGVPCQPASQAGKQRGAQDDRWLWPETFRVVEALMPTWCVFENVSGLLTLDNGVVFDNLLSELEGIGYEVQPFVIPACAVNAPHRRDRVWIVAHSTRRREEPWPERGTSDQPSETGIKGHAIDDRVQSDDGNTRRRGQTKTSICKFGEDIVPNPISERGCSRNTPGQDAEDVGELRRGTQYGNWEFESRVGGVADGLSAFLDRFNEEPDIPRVATGIKDRVNRLKSLGNAVVP